LLTWADAAALTAVLVWGASFPILKWLMTVLDPLSLMVLRAVVSAGVLFAVAVGSGGWRLPDRADARPLLLVTLVGFTLNQVLYSWGLHLTSASHSGLIFTLTPLFVFGASHLTGQVRIAAPDVVGLALGTAGAVLILGGPAVVGEQASGVSLAGDLLTVGAAITWGFWTMFAAPLLRRHGTLLTTTWITAGGAASLLPLAAPGLVRQDWSLVSGLVLAGVLFSGTLAGALGSLLWYAAVRRLGPARTAIYANLESLFAVLAAALLLGERVAWTSVAGGVAVVAGVMLTRRRG
jgi:drug/metabolite transporter (DMT)-like permease